MFKERGKKRKEIVHVIMYVFVLNGVYEGAFITDATNDEGNHPNLWMV